MVLGVHGFAVFDEGGNRGDMGTSDGWMLLRGAQPPWNEECVLVFDEHYTEANTAELHPSSTAYVYMYRKSGPQQRMHLVVAAIQYTLHAPDVEWH